ncbi:MAG: phosphatase PAP2 family protein [Pirellulales bacterium]|nr:phosphatase PAP2 family protein [Pirellulales bacterium]
MAFSHDPQDKHNTDAKPERGSATPLPLAPRTPFVLAAGLLAAALAALAIDVPVAVWCREGRVPGDLAKVLTFSEAFGHGIGVVMLAVAVFVLDPGRRAMLPRVLACSLGAGMCANVLKLLVARMRPRAFDLSASVFDSFTQFLPLGAGGSAAQSFPSAHVATAVGLAFALAWLYPRGRGYFAVLAVLVGGQRIESTAHFPSDVFFGAALGCLAATVCLGEGPVARWFARHESSHWRRRAPRALAVRR